MLGGRADREYRPDDGAKSAFGQGWRVGFYVPFNRTGEVAGVHPCAQETRTLPRLPGSVIRVALIDGQAGLKNAMRIALGEGPIAGQELSATILRCRRRWHSAK